MGEQGGGGTRCAHHDPRMGLRGRVSWVPVGSPLRVRAKVLRASIANCSAYPVLPSASLLPASGREPLPPSSSSSQRTPEVEALARANGHGRKWIALRNPLLTAELLGRFRGALMTSAVHQLRANHMTSDSTPHVEARNLSTCVVNSPKGRSKASGVSPSDVADPSTGSMHPHPPPPLYSIVNDAGLVCRGRSARIGMPGITMFKKDVAFRRARCTRAGCLEDHNNLGVTAWCRGGVSWWALWFGRGKRSRRARSPMLCSTVQVGGQDAGSSATCLLDLCGSLDSYTSDGTDKSEICTVALEPSHGIRMRYC